MKDHKPSNLQYHPFTISQFLQIRRQAKSSTQGLTGLKPRCRLSHTPTWKL